MPWLVHAIRSIFFLSLKVALVGAAILSALSFYYSTTLPDYKDLTDARSEGSVTFIDRYGEKFAWRGSQFETNLTTSSVSPHLTHAIIATEDRRFFHHFGVSPRGLARAISKNYQENGNPFKGEGGSTITTQVAKLICLGVQYDRDNPEHETQAEFDSKCRRSTLERKIKEIPYAIALEIKYTKEEILSIYLNRAYLGAGNYGFGAAADRYFGKSVSDLGIAESAMLAGTLTAPSRYAPTGNLKRAQDRAATVVRLMYEQGYITQSERDTAINTPAKLAENAKSGLGIYFADWIMRDQPDFLTTNTGEDLVFQTTFDPQIQRDVENAIRRVFEAKINPNSRVESAVVVMNKEGAVLAMLGGRFEEDLIEMGFNRATEALRQPGSSFKPIVYAAALEYGFHPFELFTDSPITVNVPGSGAWTPKNYENIHYGTVTMAEAMKKSINTIAVELSEASGRARVKRMARDLGFVSPLPDGPAIALGAAETTVLEMASIYASILNGTRRVTAYGFTDLKDKNTQEVLITNAPQIGNPVLPKQKAEWLIYMMNKVIEGGTGTRARIEGQQLAGKTGTTSNSKDAWFIGFSANYVTAVWMGWDNNTPMKDVTGGGLPAEIWAEIMRPILARSGATPLPMNTPPPYVPPAPPPGTFVPQTLPAQPQAPPPSQEKKSLNDEINGIFDALFGN